MKYSAFLPVLEQNSNAILKFILPDGSLVPAHYHITEVGRVDKTFLDCGATFRKISTLCLQAWVADDLDHRLTAGKLLAILQRAESLFANEDLDVELEYESAFISQYPVQSIAVECDVIVVTLGLKHTDCLAKDVCLPPVERASECCSSSSCC